MIDYLSQHLWQIWAVVAVLCLILELTAGDFFIICFSIGAVFAAISDPLGLGFYWQIGVFAIFTLISLYFVRPFALRYLHKGEEHRVSNADALIGRRGRVVEAVEAGGYGRVAIDGDVWKAVSTATTDIPVGASVRVTDRESIVITVEQL
ncbi:MAG: NfeD family protein [Prevotella sp.]|nr:NfeD family protein [Prevotella sp.]